MAGNPSKAGQQNKTYQVDRRRYTRVPGYHSILPRAFPFKKDMSREDAEWLVGVVLDSGELDMTGIAVTSHPRTLDGHVTVWMSAEVAEALLNTHYISYVEDVAVD